MKHFKPGNDEPHGERGGATLITTIVILMLLTVLAVEMDVFQRMLDTTSLTGSNWLAVVGLALIVPAVMEGSKAFRRARQSVRSTPEPVAPAVAVSD